MISWLNIRKKPILLIDQFDLTDRSTDCWVAFQPKKLDLFCHHVSHLSVILKYIEPLKKKI